MSIYYHTFRGIALKTPDREVSIMASEMGWSKLSRRAYYRQVQANKACSGLAGTKAKKRTGSKPANR